MKRLPIDANAKWSGTRSGVSIIRVSSVTIAADTILSSRAKVLSFPMALMPARALPTLAKPLQDKACALRSGFAPTKFRLCHPAECPLSVERRRVRRPGFRQQNGPCIRSIRRRVQALVSGHQDREKPAASLGECSKCDHDKR